MHRVLYAAGGISWLLAGAIVFVIFTGLTPGGTIGSVGFRLILDSPVNVELLGQMIGLALTLFTCGAVFIVGGAIVQAIRSR